MTAATFNPGRYAVSHLVTFGPALGLPLWGWDYLGLQHLRQPYEWVTLGLMVLAALLVIPAAIVALLFFAPKIPAGCVPRDWRKRYRKRLIARGTPRGSQHSSYISKPLRRVVLAAGRNRCAACPTRIWEGFCEMDHIMPWSLGGLTTLFNLMALCPRCNQTKSNFWRFRAGNTVYVPRPGFSNQALADEILGKERRARWNPLRLLRAAWALGA
jgi:hypothetical protein